MMFQSSCRRTSRVRPPAPPRATISSTNYWSSSSHPLSSPSSQDLDLLLESPTSDHSNPRAVASGLRAAATSGPASISRGRRLTRPCCRRATSPRQRRRRSRAPSRLNLRHCLPHYCPRATSLSRSLHLISNQHPRPCCQRASSSRRPHHHCYQRASSLTALRPACCLKALSQ